MHPEDIRVERFKESITRLRKLLAEDEAEVEAGKKDLERGIKRLYKAARARARVTTGSN